MRNAEPHRTGVIFAEIVPRLIALFKESTVTLPVPVMYASRTVSENSATSSIMWWRISVALSMRSRGISPYSYCSPISSSQWIDLISTRSITPVKVLSIPIGIWMTTGLASSFSSIIRTLRVKSAPTLSILLMKQIRGTSYRSACLQTVSDCGSTPSTASKIATAPSSTRSDLSTSIVKSTWPGVSIMFIRESCH